jgi:hypothetical protein
VGARGIDGEGGELPEVAPLEDELCGPVGRLGCLALELAREPPADLAVLDQRRDHVARPARVAELADHPGAAAPLPELDQGETAGGRGSAPATELDPAATLEEQLTDQEPPPLRDEDDAPQTSGVQSWEPSTWSAFWSPSSGLVEGMSFAFT